ncbi:hypothetical protein Q9565_001390 [Salmonella enterica]|nr:hypothetical protein [Salmonella enterica]
MIKPLIYMIVNLPFYGYCVGKTINYVWVPTGNDSITALELITSNGQRTGVVNFPMKRGTSGFSNRIYDCDVSNWSGFWNKQTYTYLSMPNKFQSSIGDLSLKTNFNDVSYQWSDGNNSIAYWQTSLVNNWELGPGSCASQGGIGTMDYYWGGAKIEITVPTLPWAGELNLNIPFYIANMEHWWNVTQGGNANWEYGYDDFKHLMNTPWYIPVKIKSFSSCKLSTQILNIDYGTITAQIATQGVSTSGFIDINCSYPTNIKITVMSNATNADNRVSCGKGDCTLSINGESTTTLENVVNNKVRVDSLFKSAQGQEGPFTGNAILRVDVT